MYQLILIVLVAFGLFYGILQLPIAGILKFALIFIEMFAVSHILIKKYKFSSEMGLILFKSDAGLKLIERMSKFDRFFNFFADVGNTLAYGLSAYIIMRKHGTLYSVFAGILLLFFLSSLVAPFAFSFLVSILNPGGSSKTLSTTAATLNLDSTLSLILFSLILLFGGFFAFLITSLVLYGMIILNAIVGFFLYGSSAIKTTAAGGSFLLPGINLPFVEGVLALAVVLVVHEGAHAVLSRIAKIKVLSSGLVFFGIIPIGAFVEPDEKELERSEIGKQSRVLIAGSTSNLIWSCIFFVIFLAFVSMSRFLGLGTGMFAPFVRFIFEFLGLTFSLNFIVGTVNLLPIPLFDGFKILDINVKYKPFVKAVTYLTIAFFLINFLPWLFHG